MLYNGASLGGYNLRLRLLPDVQLCQSRCVMQDDEIDFADQQKAGSIQHKQQYEHDFAEKQRLQKMQQDHSQFQQQIVSRRQGEFEELQVSCPCCCCQSSTQAYDTVEDHHNLVHASTPFACNCFSRTYCHTVKNFQDCT